MKTLLPEFKGNDFDCTQLDSLARTRRAGSWALGHTHRVIRRLRKLRYYSAVT